jgi:DNA-binding transcriptional LysR family regulator
MDKLQAMGLFVRIVETGGMARAAQSLRIPKATATTLIQKLEASLGAKLLNRTTRRVTVTPDGAAYYTRAAAILAEVREAEEALSQRSVAPHGRVRVDAPTLVARSVIVPALPRFFASYPGIELALACSERHFDLLAEGIDCASPAESGISISPRARRPPTLQRTAPPLIHAIWRGIAASTASHRHRGKRSSGSSPRARSACGPSSPDISRSRTRTAT